MSPAKLDLKYQVVFGSSLGLAYGFIVRLAAELFPDSGTFALMTEGFLFGVPAVMGFVSVFLAERNQRRNPATWIFLPWVSVTGCLVSLFLTFLEGFFCIVLFLPAGLVGSSGGGLIGGFLARRISGKSRHITAGCVMILPFVMNAWETSVMRQDLRHVDVAVTVKAPPEIIWSMIQRVPMIKPHELPESWTRRLGVPDPQEATMNGDGVGGVRNSSWAGGVRFVEVIDRWEANRYLGFSIRAITEEIPQTTLDKHVRVGGAYFDVLHGEYRIEPLPNGMVRLHLSSDHRLSTTFNWYAKFWTDSIMLDIQNTILHVVKNRSEAEALRKN